MPAQHRARRTRRLRRALLIVVTTIAVLYLLLVLAASRFYRRALYPAPQSFPATSPPGARLVETRASDGVLVRALLFENGPEHPVVVCFHGNGETMGHDVWIAEELHRRGSTVLLAEYRGYGLSRGEGSPTEPGLYADAVAVLDMLRAEGIGDDRVVLLGMSLGTGVATEMALRGRGQSVVLVSPYTSIPDMARTIVPFGLPVDLIVGDRFDTFTKAPSVRQPVLVIHGDSDAFIPLRMGEELAGRFPHAELRVVRGGHHGDVMAVDPDGVFGAITAFAKRAESL